MDMGRQEPAPLGMSGKGGTMATVSSKGVKNAQAFLSKFRAEFQGKYKYRIGGQDDPFFEKIARNLTDAKSFAKLRSKRYAELREINAIKAQGLDADAEKAAIAKIKLKFINEARRLLNAQAGIKKPRIVTDVTEDIARELTAVVDDYFTGRAAAGGVNEADDAAFLSQARKLQETLETLNKRQKPRLIQNKVFFDIQFYKSGRLLDSLEGRLDILV